MRIVCVCICVYVCRAHRHPGIRVTGSCKLPSVARTWVLCKSRQCCPDLCHFSCPHASWVVVIANNPNRHTASMNSSSFSEMCSRKLSLALKEAPLLPSLCDQRQCLWGWYAEGEWALANKTNTEVGGFESIELIRTEDWGSPCHLCLCPRAPIKIQATNTSHRASWLSAISAGREIHFNTIGQGFQLSGLQQALHRSHISDRLHIRYFTLWHITIAHLQLWSKGKNNVMVGGYHNMQNFIEEL